MKFKKTLKAGAKLHRAMEKHSPVPKPGRRGMSHPHHKKHHAGMHQAAGGFFWPA